MKAMFILIDQPHACLLQNRGAMVPLMLRLCWATRCIAFTSVCHILTCITSEPADAVQFLCLAIETKSF